MLTGVLNTLVILFPILLTSDAFWWNSSPTEAPPPPSLPVMKQIPLTYYRIYTYQQPLGSSPEQPPLLSSTDYITNYNALSNTPYFNPLMPVIPMGVAANNQVDALTPRPLKIYNKLNVEKSMGPLPLYTTKKPEKTTATTTTSTTTTPQPTTTASSESPTTLQIDATSSAIPPIQLNSMDNVETAYPGFNRRSFTNHFNMDNNRPAYPYPEYMAYKFNYPVNGENNKITSNIELVPCMCSVNIPSAGLPLGYQTGIPITGNPTYSMVPAQGAISAKTEASNLLDDPEAVKLKSDREVSSTSA